MFLRVQWCAAASIVQLLPITPVEMKTKVISIVPQKDNMYEHVDYVMSLR